MTNYTFLKHTADVRMRVVADTFEELLKTSLIGLAELILHEDKVPKESFVNHEIHLKAPDKTALLIDFLNEVLSLSHTNGVIYTVVEFTNLSETNVDAMVMGVPVDAFDEDVKAVTYHEADIHKNEKGELETTIIFDI